MIESKIFDLQDYKDEVKTRELVGFLFQHLGEFGDPEDQIWDCLTYAFSPAEGKGGLVTTLRNDGVLLAAAVVNHTGMSGYIPANQLVYIAVHKDHRGQGLGKKLLSFTLDNCSGEMALHVEYHNPAKFLYESLGFKSKYAEMRRPGGKSHG